MDRSRSYSSLADGLLLRAAQSAEDVERLAVFNASIHGTGLDGLTRALATEHPQARRDYWLFVEAAATQQVVASLCLIPWTLRYGEVELHAAEMGIVGTAVAYRRRGLIAALNQRFDELLQRDGFDLSIIQGIPYFYRQFGYEYAMPLELWCRVDLHQFATVGGQAPTFELRAASTDDLPRLMDLYAEASAQLDISTLRDAATWHYLLGPGLTTETGGETLLILAADGAAAGYMRVMAHGFGEGLICGEASLLRYDAALAALRLLCELARMRGKPYLRLNLPPGHVLNMLALQHGAHASDGYAWQVKLPDPAALLLKLAPLFARRLRNSPFAEWEGVFVINLYRERLALTFAAGQLRQIERLAPGNGDLSLPPQLLAPLLLGWRSLADLRHSFPDVGAYGAGRALAEVLFPLQSAFLYSIY